MNMVSQSVCVGGGRWTEVVGILILSAWSNCRSVEVVEVKVTRAGFRNFGMLKNKRTAHHSVVRCRVVVTPIPWFSICPYSCPSEVRRYLEAMDHSNPIGMELDHLDRQHFEFGI